MCLYCLTISQNLLNISVGKVVFEIFAKIEMMRNKNRLFGRYFETVQHFDFLYAGIKL